MVNRADKPKDVVFSKIYINVFNELVFRSLLIQLLIIGACFSIRHIVFGDFRDKISKAYDHYVIDAKTGVLNAQKVNLMINFEDQIDVLHFHANLLNMTTSGLTPSDLADIPSISSGGLLKDSGFYIDGLRETDYSSLETDIQDTIKTMDSLLSTAFSSIEVTNDTSWIKAISVSSRVNQEYVTVLKSNGKEQVDLASIFSYASSCFDNSLCLANCMQNDGFSFECLNKLTGPHFSPLKLSGASEDNGRTFVYSTNIGQSYNVAFFIVTDSASSRELLKSSSIQAVLFNNASSEAGVSSSVLQMMGLRKKEAFSLYSLDAENTNHFNTLTSWLKTFNDSSAEFNLKNQTWVSATFSQPSLWGFNIFGSLQVPERAFKFLKYHTKQDALAIDSLENLLLILVFTGNFIVILGYLRKIIMSVLKDMDSIREIMKGNQLSSKVVSTFTYREMQALGHQISYYNLIVKFIQAIKGKDSLNHDILEQFLEPIKASDNHLAQVYLFNFFSRPALLVKEHAERGDMLNLDESIRYGSLLYKTYNLMVSDLIASGNCSEFELRRMNMSTFRLLEVMLDLMMKSAKASQEYTYENVLALYDKTFYYVDLLNMNDTVRLGLLLKKLKILIRLKKFSLADVLLSEIEKMSDLLLKNKRILMYMEDEYNLLTFYKQQYLNLKSEFYYEKSELGSVKQAEDYLDLSKKCIFKMINYGDIFNVPLRTKGLQRLCSIVDRVTTMEEFSPENRKSAPLWRLITFTKNENRRIMLLIDCSTECINYVDQVLHSFREVLEKVLRKGDIVTAFAFDTSLYPMKDGSSNDLAKLSIQKRRPKEIYNFVTRFFEFLRFKVKDNVRDYYANMLSAIKQSEKAWSIEGETDPGYPVYLIMAVFGSHRGGKEKGKILALKNAMSSGRLGKSIDKPAQIENTYTQIQKTIESQMMNFMLITNSLEEVKKEKLLQIVFYSKRSLVLDLAAEKPDLSKNFEDFIN